MSRGVVLLSILLVVSGLSTACSGWFARTEGLDRTTLPDAVRPDYDLFALRCSKCHSLARPLNSGIVEDDYWAMYVARMRRQPGSGISMEDTVVILRFLHYYSAEQLKKKEKPPAAQQGPAPAPPPAPAPAPPASGGLGAARARVL